MKKHLIPAQAEPLESRIAPAVFIVNTNGDPSSPLPDTLSLREALLAASAHTRPVDRRPG
jgi:hypothetical protein